MKAAAPLLKGVLFAALLAALFAAVPARRPGVGDLLLANGRVEREALDRIVARMIETPTAQELLPELLALRRPVRVVFDPEIEARVLRLDGRERLYGGLAFFQHSDLSVRLSPLFLHPARRDKAAAMLAHELLGHAARHLRYDVPSDILTHYIGSETYATLVGDVVGMELGDVEAARAARYLARDRVTAERGRVDESRSYILSLSVGEMADAVASYKARIARLRREYPTEDPHRDIEDFYFRAIDHFVAEHGERRSTYSVLIDKLEASRVLGDQLLQGRRNADYLERFLLDFGKGPRPSPEALALAASHPHILDLEARIARLSARVLARDVPPERRAPYIEKNPERAILRRAKEDAAVHPKLWAAEMPKLYAARRKVKRP